MHPKSTLPWLWLSLLFWAGLYTWSFVAFAQTEAIGDGFTRGSNRIGQFLLFQFIAAIAAIFTWRIGARLSASPALRWISRVPLALSLLLIAGIVGFFIYGIFFI